MDNQPPSNNPVPTPEDDAAMEAKMFAAAVRAVQQAFQGFTIQGGNRIRISGSGRNMTVAYEDPSDSAGGVTPGSGGGTPGSGGGGSGAESIGQWYSLTLCDGTTLDVWASNIVPP